MINFEDIKEFNLNFKEFSIELIQELRGKDIILIGQSENGFYTACVVNINDDPEEVTFLFNDEFIIDDVEEFQDRLEEKKYKFFAEL